jgi:hypothetical protein
MESLRTSRVFVPGGMPELTYVVRKQHGLEERLARVTDNLCKLVSVTGTTKSGKTVLANMVFPRTSPRVLINGGSIGREDDFWNSILSQIGGYTEASVEDSSTSQSSNRVNLGASLGLASVFGGKIEREDANGGSRTTTQAARVSLSARSAAISLLSDAQHPLVVDDFHYLNRELQGEIIRALKAPVSQGLPVVLISIPHRRFDALKAEIEMTGRLENIEVPPWSVQELLLIPQEGFGLLNIHTPASVSQQMAAESFGSPHLMQEFCRTLAESNGVSEASAQPVYIASIDGSLFARVARATGNTVFQKLARGSRQRADRIQRQLTDGTSEDIYSVVLHALANLAPGLQPVPYEELRRSIRGIVAKGMPQSQEVSRVLDRMTEIASGSEITTPVLEWDRGEQQLHITDPFFAFYLKWAFIPPFS